MQTLDQTAAIASIADLLGSILARHGDAVATRHDTGESYVDTTYAEALENSSALARWFLARPNPQQLVVTLCKNRPEWDMTALAVFHTANILCPLDITMNHAELEGLLSLRPPDVMLVSRAQLARVRELQRRLGFRAEVLVADLHCCYEDLGVIEEPLPGECSLRQIRDQYRASGTPAASPLLDNPATILAHYATSGTTGLPRIVRISHGNIVAAVDAGFDIVNLRPTEDVLNIGAYTHIATLIEFLVTKTKGFAVSYLTREPDEPDVDHLPSARPAWRRRAPVGTGLSAAGPVGREGQLARGDGVASGHLTAGSIRGAVGGVLSRAFWL